MGPWKPIKDLEEMARHIHRANIQEYHQADQTPFANTPLGHAVGPFAETEIANKILHGEAISAHLTTDLLAETKAMLAQLGSPYSLVPTQLKVRSPWRIIVRYTRRSMRRFRRPSQEFILEIIRWRYTVFP